jgi:hypothetical protein
VEKAAWISFKYVTINFLGNHKAENYRDMVADLVQSYKAMGCNVYLKVHFLDSHLDFFPKKSGGSERFHQDISTLSKQYQASAVTVCWLIIAGHLEETLHRQNTAESYPLLLFR